MTADSQSEATPLAVYNECLGAQMSRISRGKYVICAIPNETWDEEALAQQRKHAKEICDALNSLATHERRIAELEETARNVLKMYGDAPMPHQVEALRAALAEKE